MAYITDERSRSKDKMLILLRGYPKGATIAKVMLDNGLTNPDTVLDATNLLEDEGQIRVERSQGNENHREGIMVYPSHK